MSEMQYISCIRFSMQLLIAETVFVLHWKRKEHFAVRFTLAMLGYIVLSFGMFRVFHVIQGYNPVVYMSYYTGLFFLTLGIMWSCFQVEGKEILFSGVCGYATQHIAFAVYTIFIELTGIKLAPFYDFLLFRILPYVIVAWLMYMTVIRKYEEKGELKNRDIRMIFLAFIILMTVICVSVFVDSHMFQNQSGLLINVFCKIYAILCCILAIFVAFNLSMRNRMEHEKEMMEQLLHRQQEQQKLSRENINIINIKCHDLKYRISKISHIENSNDQKEYIESIRKAISIYDNIYQTGNDAMDLILTEKSLLCDEYNIKLSCMVEGKLLDFMNTTDVYALFGNLLDNAIESVMKEQDEAKRIISMTVSKKNQGCHIHVDNYCVEQVIFRDGLPQTTKTDKVYHGFGVRSIKYITDKYHGDMLMQAANQRFQVDILFYS